MRLLAFLFAVSIAAATPAAEEPLQSQEGLERWMTYYYLKPDPSRFVEAVRYMASSGVLENQGAIPPVFGFIAGVVRNNPGKLDAWVRDVESLSDSQLSTVALGIWYAELPTSKKVVYRFIERRPGVKERLSTLLQGPPMPIRKIPLEEGPWVLDANWGNFMATGARDAVLRIISALPWMDAKGDTNRLETGAAASWSLTSNAIQYKKVLEICESEIPKQPKKIAEKLKAVVANAKNKLDSESRK